MWLKLAGSLLVLWGATGAGTAMAARLKERQQTLNQLRQMVYFIKGEITYSRAPLAEALERVGGRWNGALSRMFLEIAEDIRRQTGEPFRVLWNRRAEEACGGLPLTKEDREQLKALGTNLGYLDVAMQERTLLFYLEQLDLSIAELEGQRREKCRLYISLGALGGIFLVILML